MQKEIITLQLGHYANFVGAHCWNFLSQDLAAKQLSARKHADVDYETEPEAYFHFGNNEPVPRLIAFDIKGCIGSLSESGQFSNGDQKKASSLNSQAHLAWHGEAEITERSHQVHPKESEESENSIKVWSDYLKTRLHPKSLVLAPSSYAAVDVCETDLRQDGGENINKAMREEIEDRLRFFAEACDALEGFHVLTTMHDGCSPLSLDLLHVLSDDFARKSVLVVPVEQPQLPNGPQAKSAPIQRLANWASWLPASWSDCSLIVPLSLSAHSLWQGPLGEDERYADTKLPGLHYNSSSDYHTSALLASALDTMTLPYRLSAVGEGAYSPRCTMSEYFGLASKYFKLNQLEIALPFPLRQPPSLNGPSQLTATKPLSVQWTSLCPPTTATCNRLLSRSACLRGLEGLPLPDSSPTLADVQFRRHVFSHCQQDFEATLDANRPVVDSFVRTRCSLVARDLDVRRPFPRSILSAPDFQGRGLSMASVLSSSSQHLGAFLGQLHGQCSRLSPSKFAQILPESTEWAEHLEWLVDKAQQAIELK